jgi:hypothetical protein
MLSDKEIDRVGVCVTALHFEQLMVMISFFKKRALSRSMFLSLAVRKFGALGRLTEEALVLEGGTSVRDI